MLPFQNKKLTLPRRELNVKQRLPNGGLFHFYKESKMQNGTPEYLEDMIVLLRAQHTGIPSVLHDAFHKVFGHDMGKMKPNVVQGVTYKGIQVTGRSSILICLVIMDDTPVPEELAAYGTTGNPPYIVYKDRLTKGGIFQGKPDPLRRAKGHTTWEYAKKAFVDQMKRY